MLCFHETLGGVFFFSGGGGGGGVLEMEGLSVLGF